MDQTTRFGIGSFIISIIAYAFLNYKVDEKNKAHKRKAPISAFIGLTLFILAARNYNIANA